MMRKSEPEHRGDIVAEVAFDKDVHVVAKSARG
jgi:hypothetical protein